MDQLVAVFQLMAVAFVVCVVIVLYKTCKEKRDSRRYQELKKRNFEITGVWMD